MKDGEEWEGMRRPEQAEWGNRNDNNKNDGGGTTPKVEQSGRGGEMVNNKKNQNLTIIREKTFEFRFPDFGKPF